MGGKRGTWDATGLRWQEEATRTTSAAAALWTPERYRCTGFKGQLRKGHARGAQGVIGRSHRSSSSSGDGRAQAGSPNDSSDAFSSARRSVGTSARVMLRRMLARFALAARAGLALFFPTAKKPRRGLEGPGMPMEVNGRAEKGEGGAGEGNE